MRLASISPKNMSIKPLMTCPFLSARASELTPSRTSLCLLRHSCLLASEHSLPCRYFTIMKLTVRLAFLLVCHPSLLFTYADVIPMYKKDTPCKSNQNIKSLFLILHFDSGRYKKLKINAAAMNSLKLGKACSFER